MKKKLLHKEGYNIIRIQIHLLYKNTVKMLERIFNQILMIQKTRIMKIVNMLLKKIKNKYEISLEICLKIERIKIN
jgi:hypothetical protein